MCQLAAPDRAISHAPLTGDAGRLQFVRGRYLQFSTGIFLAIILGQPLSGKDCKGWNNAGSEVHS